MKKFSIKSPKGKLLAKKLRPISIVRFPSAVLVKSPYGNVAASSTRLAKASFKRMIAESETYRQNVYSFLENEEMETKSAVSVTSNRLPALQRKYKAKSG